MIIRAFFVSQKSKPLVHRCPGQKIKADRHIAVGHLNLLKSGAQRLYPESSVLQQFNVAEIRGRTGNGITVFDNAAVDNERVAPVGFGVTVGDVGSKDIAGDPAVGEQEKEALLRDGQLRIQRLVTDAFQQAVF